MRSVYIRPKTGDTRVVKKFLLFPYTIYGLEIVETRWLETVYIKQVSTQHEEWRNIGFVEGEEK
jgi:hypothetical protein